MEQFREKKHRLEKIYYKGLKAVSFTGCVLPGKDSINKINIFLRFEEILIKESKKCNIDLMIYLFMPDHFHIITIGKNDNSDPLDFMKRFKQSSGYWFSQTGFPNKWQKDFFDHIIRIEKDLENQFYYILNNPVRKGIVANWKDYPFKGSTTYELDKID